MCVSGALRQIQEVENELNPPKKNIIISIFNSFIAVTMVMFFAVTGAICLLFGGKTPKKSSMNIPYKIEPRS